MSEDLLREINILKEIHATSKEFEVAFNLYASVAKGRIDSLDEKLNFLYFFVSFLVISQIGVALYIYKSLRG